jgi:hypothetical protein
MQKLKLAMGMKAKNSVVKKAEAEVKVNAKVCLDRVLAQPRLDLYRNQDRVDRTLNRGPHLNRAQDLPLNEEPERKAQKRGRAERAKAKAIQDRAHERHRRVVHVDLPDPDLAQDQDHAIRVDPAPVQDQLQGLQ